MIGLLLLIGSAGCSRAEKIIGDPVALIPAPEARPPVEGAFLLGINEAVAIPHRKYPEEPEPQRQLNQDARLAAALGARVVRGHTFNFPYVSWQGLKDQPEEIRQMDQWVTAVQGEGLIPIGMVSPWPGNRTGNYTERYVPEDLKGYRAYVRALVERYDGDGNDDMPGLKAPVRYWEIDNEPDLKNTTLPIDPVRKYDPSTFCTPQQYATVLLASSAAIRDAYPGARILNGGLYRPAAESTWAWMDELLAIDGVRASFDILSLHTYSDESGRVVNGIHAMRQRINDRPVWITEISVPSRGPEGRGQAYQARMVAALIARAAAAGASALLWHSLADPDPAERTEDRGYSLLQVAKEPEGEQKKEEKPAGAVFRNLSVLLNEHSLNGAAEGEPGQVRLVDGSVILWEGSVKEHRGGLNLLTGTRIDPGTTAHAPAFLLP